MDFANHVPPLPTVPKMLRISHQICAKTASLQANLPVLGARGQVVRQVVRLDGSGDPKPSEVLPILRLILPLLLLMCYDICSGVDVYIVYLSLTKLMVGIYD